MQLNSKLLQTDILVGNSILDFKSVHHVTYVFYRPDFDEENMCL